MANQSQHDVRALSDAAEGASTPAAEARVAGEAPLEPEAASGVVPAARSANIPYLLGVDHLRCGASLLILYYHGIQLFSAETRYGQMFARENWMRAPDPLSALVLEGHTAVTLFIVLSGFIFAFGAQGRHVAYRQFLTNRFFRTYPLLIFMVMLGSAVHLNSISLLPLLQTVFGGANLHGAQSLGNFSIMFWSVSLEWQLYLLFPALMVIMNGRGPARLLPLCALLLGARAVGFWQGMAPVDGLYSQVLGRLDQFIFGMMAGYFYAKHRRHPGWTKALGPVVIALLGAAYAFNHIGGWPAQHWVKLLTPTAEGALWALFIPSYVALVDRENYRPGFISRRMIQVGVLSYSIYLWHFVFIQIQRSQGWVPRLVEHHELNAILVVTLTTLPATLLFSSLSYEAVEKPFMALRKRYLATSATAATAAARAPAQSRAA